jgi:hypothetical protein
VRSSNLPGADLGLLLEEEDPLNAMGSPGGAGLDIGDWGAADGPEDVHRASGGIGNGMRFGRGRLEDLLPLVDGKPARILSADTYSKVSARVDVEFQTRGSVGLCRACIHVYIDTCLV